MTVTQTGPSTVGAGGTVTFNALVVNSGRTDVTNFTIAETLTSGYTAAFACTASEGAVCPTTLGALITVPDLPAGRFLTISYQVQVPSSARGAIVNQVEVGSSNDPDSSNNLSVFTTTATNSANGTYSVYAADGRQYSLVIDFDALTYTLSGNGLNLSRTFTQSGAEYVVSGNSRLRVAQDLVIGSDDFGGGVIPYVAARSFLTAWGDSAYNLATLNLPAGGAAPITHPGSARISGNTLSICQTESGAYSSQDCPIVLTSYLLTANAGVFTGSDTASTNTFTFRLAKSGNSVMLLSAQPAPDGSQQLSIGLQESAGLTWGTVYGPTLTGDWVTIMLDSTNVEYAVLGSITNDQAGLQRISNSGPFAMMLGTRVSDSADIYVLQANPVVVVVGAVDGAANGTFQIGLP